MTAEKNSPWLPYVMVSPAFLIMLLVVVYPILNTVWMSFTSADGSLTLANYFHFFTGKKTHENLAFTMIEAVSTTTLAVFFSFFLALYIRFNHSPLAKLIGNLYLLVRFVPGIAAVNAVISFIRDSGVINRFFMQFGLSIKPGLLYDIKGIIVSNLWFTIPFSTMLMSAALANISDSYVESARDVGCRWPGILKNIILPLIKKDIAIAATFVLMGQIGAFTIPYLTGPNNPKMLGIQLYQEVATYMEYERAAALSVLMFVICLGGAIVYIRTNLKQADWEQL